MGQEGRRNKVRFLWILIGVFLLGTTLSAEGQSSDVIEVMTQNSADNFLWTSQIDKIGDKRKIILEFKNSQPAVRRLALLSDTKEAAVLSYFLRKHNLAHNENHVYLREGSKKECNGLGKIWATFPYWGQVTEASWNALPKEDQSTVLRFYTRASDTKNIILFEAKMK